MKTLMQEAEALSSRIIANRRALHAMPELQMELPETEAYIAQQLRLMGAEDVTACAFGGVTAMIRGDGAHPCVAIRADCDALPVREETGLPFASQNGNMHACAHDAHMAMALGAAELLIRHRAELRGSVKLIFQPCEEADGGAKAMVAGGVLEGVDEIIGLHTGNVMGMQYDTGDVVIPDGPASANIWAFKAVFHGAGAHVCTPEHARDPVYMAAKAVTRIKEEVACLCENGRPVIAGVTVVRGGVESNIIPAECAIEGSVRAFDKALHGRMRNAIEAICKEEAERGGGSVSVASGIDLGGTVNTPHVRDRFRRVARALVPEGRIKPLDPPVPIGEDFARFLDVVPGVYFFLSSKPAGECFPHHNPRFDIDESVLYMGAALLAGYPLLRED